MRKLIALLMIACGLVAQADACVVEVILGITVDSVRGHVVRAADSIPIEAAVVEIWTTKAESDDHSTCESCSIRHGTPDPKAKIEPELRQTDPKQRLLFSVKTGKDGGFLIPEVSPGKYEIVFRSEVGSRRTFLHVVPKRKSGQKEILTELASFYGGPRCASVRAVKVDERTK